MSSPASSGEGGLPAATATLRYTAGGLAAVLLVSICVALGQEAGSFGSWVWIAVGLGLGGGGLVIGCAWLWSRVPVGWGWLLAVVLVALAARVALLPSERMLSDDACRYHWDGKVLVHGINPYLYAPDAPEVAHLRRDPPDARINHPDRVTVYPPLAQLLFAVGYWLLPGSLIGFSILCLLAELACWLLLLLELHRRGLPRAWLLLAAWSPLLVCQGYLAGHVDLLGLPFVALLVVALSRGWMVRAGLALALACLIKPLAVIFVPALVVQLGWRRGALSLGVAALVGLAFYLPFVGAGWNLFASTWLMFSTWSFNGSLAGLFEALLPLSAAHWVAAGCLAALLGLSAWRGRDLITRMLLAMAALVVCSPTLFPWYLVWMFPLLVLRPDPALLVLGLLAPLTDLTVIGYTLDGSWILPVWVQLVEYVPFYALGVASAWRGWGMFGPAVRGADPATR